MSTFITYKHRGVSLIFTRNLRFPTSYIRPVPNSLTLQILLEDVSSSRSDTAWEWRVVEGDTDVTLPRQFRSKVECLRCIARCIADHVPLHTKAPYRLTHITLA